MKYSVIKNGIKYTTALKFNNDNIPIKTRAILEYNFSVDNGITLCMIMKYLRNNKNAII